MGNIISGERENGCYVLAQCGYHDNGRRTFGNSMIIDPWGTILKSKTFQGLISCNIDLEKVNFIERGFCNDRILVKLFKNSSLNNISFCESLPW